LSSSFGQTFFISLFSERIRAEFALSHGDFGTLYSLATLASAASLIWVGRKIDDVDLRLYTLLICCAVIGASFFMAAAPSVGGLFFAVFALRISGQGLMGHTAATSMARYFDKQRGKAMSVVSLGYPLGEASLPLIAVSLMSAIGWRQTWVVIGVVLSLTLAPLALWLLKGHKERHRQHVEKTNAPKPSAGPAQRQWTRREVLRDPRFFLILPNALAAPFILTGFFFNQVYLAATKGWSLTWLATCFIGYAAAVIVASLFSGPLVDRVGAARLLPFYLLPMVLGLGVLAVSAHPGAALFYMTAAGLSTGASHTILGAMWAEIYGIAHLGAIRALTSALMVFSTSLSPAAMGLMIDYGVTMEVIAMGAVGFILISIVLVKAAKLSPLPSEVRG